MAFMERIPAPVTDGELTVIRMLRHYCAMRDRQGEGGGLSRLVVFGQTLHLPPAAGVALASVFQLTEAVLGRCLVAERVRSEWMSRDEWAVIRMLGARLPTVAGTGTPDIPHGLPGALAWAVLSVRRLCGDLVPSTPRSALGKDIGCPFPAAA